MKPSQKPDVARTARRLHAAGWVANHDGNVSLRLGRDRFLCTPTAISKADVDETMLIVVDGSGRLIEGTRKPFGEIDLHLAIYRARPDANAVIHAHPPHASAFGVAGVSLEVAAMPEVLVSLGEGVPTVPLALPKTPALVDGVSQAARQSHAFLVAGNGAFSLGVDLEQAYLRMELVEHYAKIVHLARQLGGVRELDHDQRRTMLDARRKAGLEPPEATTNKAASTSAVDAGTIAERVARKLDGQAEADLRRHVVSEIKAALERR